MKMTAKQMEKKANETVKNEKKKFNGYRGKDNKFLKKEVAIEEGLCSKRTGEPTQKYWKLRKNVQLRKMKEQLRAEAQKAKDVEAKAKAKVKAKAKAVKEAEKAKEAEERQELLNQYRKELLEAGQAPADVAKVNRLPRNYGKEVEVQIFADLKSPYDLNRRSGYASIWKKLAENASAGNDKKALNALKENERIPKECFVSWKKLSNAVNKDLSSNSADWYKKEYTDNGKVYDVNYNAKVIARHPYNVRIEELGQRVIVDPEFGAMLISDTKGTPRILKRKGRKVNGEDNRHVVILEKKDEPVVPSAKAPVAETETAKAK